MRRTLLTLFFAVAASGWLIASSPAHAQTAPAAGASTGVTIPSTFNHAPAKTETHPKTELPPAGTITVNGVRYYLTTKTPYEYYLAVVTVVVGVLAMSMVCWLFHGHLATKTDDFVKLFAFVVVVFSALFLIAVGYSDTQTAPVYSLLGTIIGYLFGRDLTRRQQKADAEDDAAEATSPKKPRPPAAVTASTGASHS
jgi:uncharacterized membrane protein